VNKITSTLSNEQSTQIKVVNLEKLWYFVVGNFLFELIYYFMKSFENSKVIDFKIGVIKWIFWNSKQSQMKKLSTTKF
jgi:hypothetical protein